MMKNSFIRKIIVTTFSSLLAGHSVIADEAITARLDVKGACRSSESWSFGTHLDKEWIEEFEGFISGKASITRGFAEALAMRKSSLSETEPAFKKLISEYWIARSLFSAKFYHQAHQAFVMMAKTSGEVVIQKAAVQCMAEIQKQVPSLEVPAALPWKALQGDSGNADALLLSFFNQSALPETDSKNMSLIISTLQSYRVPHSDFAEGVLYSRTKNYPKSTEALERFFSHLNTGEFLSKYSDSGRILMARAYYSMKKYSLATKNFHMIKKNSNELTEVLSELSWSYLMSGHYEESVGVVMQLRARGFKNAFTPEASMVSAMAFNELCQYPASLSVLQNFKAEYAAEYAWLKKWSLEKKVSLYADAVQFVRGKSEVPVKIGNEWIRSASFLSRQVELNLILKQMALSQQMSQQARQEHKKMRTKITASILKFIDKYVSEKRNLKPGEKISLSLYGEYQSIRSQFQHYYRFAQAARPWKKISDGFQKKLPAIREQLVASIEKDLTAKNSKMLALLLEIAENNELIAAEIYTGASQDLVWKNAHPDYVQVVKSFNKSGVNRRPASEVWNWGKMRASEIDSPEVWEDEVGFAKADLTDNCADKEKYLKVKASVITVSTSEKRGAL